MNPFYDDALLYEKPINIIIDLGFSLTKVGFGNESEPRKIMQTPNFFDYEKFMQEDTEMQMKKIESELIHPEELTNFSNPKSLLSYRKESAEIEQLVEGFIYNILFNVLQLKKQQKDKTYACILCVNFDQDFQLCDIYELVVKSILNNPLIICVRILPTNILPIYASGYSSGIIVDSGYLNTRIIPINNSTPYYEKSEILSICSMESERFLKRKIIEENILRAKKKVKNPESLSQGVIKHLNDLIVRGSICVKKELSLLLNDQNEEIKLKNENDFCRVDFCKDLQDFQISFQTRVDLGENYFGDISQDKCNVAYSLLKVIQKIYNEDRKKLCQNVVLSGGSTMLIGFYKRLLDEINYFIEEKEFENIKHLKDLIRVHKVIFPRNCLTWIGASLVTAMDKFNFKHLTINKDHLINSDDSVKRILSNFIK